MVDWSATAAWVTVLLTLIVSIVSPVITTFLNHRFQLKMRKLELLEHELDRFYEKKVSTIETFLSAVGKCSAFATNDLVKECGHSFYNIYLYTPVSLWSDIDRMHKLISEGNWPEVQAFLPCLSKSLAEILEKTQKKYLQ